jgi:hypothetical protein
MSQDRLQPKQRDPEQEFVITHSNTMADSGTHVTKLVPPPGPGWKPVQFCASHHATHILWSRVRQEG